MYTAQRNSNGNVIVCKGDAVRNSYQIVFTGSYGACLSFKVRSAEDQDAMDAYAQEQSDIDETYIRQHGA